MGTVHPDILPCGFRHEAHKTVTASDIRLWAGLTGRRLPSRGGQAFAQQTAVARDVAPDAFLTGLVMDTAAMVAARIPPPGALLTLLAVQFTAPVFVGTTVAVVVTVAEWDAAARLYWLDICLTRADGTLAVIGKAGLRPHTTLLPAACTLRE